MPSSFLAFFFAAVMVTITWVNHLRETPREAQLAAVIEVVPTPAPAPVPAPASPRSLPPLAMPQDLENNARLNVPLPLILQSPTPRPPTPRPPTPLPPALQPPLPLAQLQVLPPPAEDLRSRTEIIPPEIGARAYILADANGAVLASRNITASLPVASLTKLMTAVVFAELFPRDGSLVILEHTLALNLNTFGLASGTVLSKQQALEFLLIVSSNIVAESAAEALGGADFVARMNAKAFELGMTDTFFIDASGLKHFSRSSARDVITLLRYIALNHPEILVISRMPSAVFGSHTLLNTNELLGQVAGIVGGKTGTNAAGTSLAVVFEWRGRTFFAAVINTQDRARDMRSLIEYVWNLP